MSLDIAKKCLQSNIIALPSGPYLVAGQNQYKTIWTRDFCYSIRGLLGIDRADVAKNQLQKLIDFARPIDGLIPRVLDNVPARYRVVWNSLRKITGPILPNFKFNDPLKPEYVDEHGSFAMDSNILLVLNSIHYSKKTGDLAFLERNESKLKRILDFYSPSIDKFDGFINQSKYSDWQDSVHRQGKTFYLNHLYWWTLKELNSLNLFNISAEAVNSYKDRLFDNFMSKDLALFYSVKDHHFYSLDGNLMAIDSGLTHQDPTFYTNLKNSPFWKSNPHKIPGFNTFPRYPKEWHHLPVKIVGLLGYHDHIYWSWLMAYSISIAKNQNDIREYELLKSSFEAMIERDKTIHEIFHPHNLHPWRSRIFQSEAPFSWGAAFAIEALQDSAADVLKVG